MAYWFCCCLALGALVVFRIPCLGIDQSDVVNSFWLATSTILEPLIFVNRAHLPAKVAGWRRLIYSDLPHISAMHTSIHFTLRTTAVLLIICFPLIAMIWLPGRRYISPKWSIAACVLVGNLILRWVLELWARYDDGPYSVLRDTLVEGTVGSGNEDLDICFERVYAKSRLTVWVEHAFHALTRFCALCFTRRSRAGQRRQRRQVWADYTDDGEYDEDAEENLLLLSADSNITIHESV